MPPPPLSLSAFVFLLWEEVRLMAVRPSTSLSLIILSRRLRQYVIDVCFGSPPNLINLIHTSYGSVWRHYSRIRGASREIRCTTVGVRAVIYLYTKRKGTSNQRTLSICGGIFSLCSWCWYRDGMVGIRVKML